MANKTVLITGASDGIGAAAARQLSALGERVIIVGRSPEKTRQVANELDAPHHVADFQDLEQVKALAATLLKEYPQIDVLANNAGGIFTEVTTKDEFDKTFQVNHLAPFLLTELLMDRLIASNASVIQTTSNAAKMFGKIDIDDLNNTGKWSANKAYGDAKLANILFTKELQTRYGNMGIAAACFHPGGVATGFASDTSSWMRHIVRNPIGRRLMLITPDKGAETLTWLAEGTPGQTWQPGEFYEKKKATPANKLNPQSNDADLARRLWERSEKMLRA
ncbi:SDR family NAD(P)-dependent oxidoreductase [Nocardia sp. NPDC005366]|uniref:SDR family NAD(P)-dependent oxidoreductase n=1 Tax=Nocardia sp. NPDC005366 TaxID=3156878 RepID=UPI0033B4F6CB